MALKATNRAATAIRESTPFQEVFSFSNLLKAYYECRKSKRSSRDAKEFEMNFEKELLEISRELKNKSYETGKYTCFAITDPKIREVWAADFRDRIVHHLLVDHLESVWERKFIFHSYACRKNKGAHKAIINLQKTLKKEMKKDKKLWYLKIDVESFFTSIDLPMLFSLIKNNVDNDDILWLSQLIILQNPTEKYVIKGDRETLASVPKNKSLFNSPPNKGLPIGNYTSQFFANVYLNEIDQFVKHSLKCRYYFRYMDDLLLLSENKDVLLCWKNDISNILENRLRLKIHPKKQIIQPVSYGIDFLGYILKPDYTLSRKRIVANLKKKLHQFNKMMDNNTKPWGERSVSALPLIFHNQIPDLKFIEKAQSIINSYYGHFQHGNCYSLRKNLYCKYFKELKNFMDPADKNFSSFVIKPAIKRFYQEKNKNH